MRPTVARKDIEIVVANLRVDVVYDGASIGYFTGGDRCFDVVVDGQTKGDGVCGFAFAVNDLAPGEHTVVLQQRVPPPPGPMPMPTT